MTIPFRRILPLVSLATLVVLGACASDDGGGGDGPTPTPTVVLGEPVGEVELCAQDPVDELCSFLPHNVIAPNLSGAGYSQLGAAEQRPFDNFSWQSFVALNWPARPDGTPLDVPIGSRPEAPRVWHSYPTSLEVFGVDLPEGPTHSPAACAALGEDLPVLQLAAKSGIVDREPASILQATEQPLIDRNLNFVLFDVRVNPKEQEYILGNSLNTTEGQMAFQMAGSTVSFPTGFYDDDDTRTGGEVGAMEIKTAWRILDEASGDQPDRFYTMRAHVYVSASASADGEAFCFPATLGLVGMHIIQRTSGPRTFGLDWIWSTFEHVDNAPLAANPGDPTSLTALPDDCAAPSSVDDMYSFYDPSCASSECPPNGAPTPGPDGEFLWASEPPYARQYATNQTYGTQVVRCWEIYAETAGVNEAFHRALDGTVWENYVLINTQWQGGIESPEENGNIPRFLGNAVLETYILGNASCLDCHAFAKTTAGQDANFSFLLGLAVAGE